MTLYEIALVSFAVGALIHGAQLMLVAKQWRRAASADHSRVVAALRIGLITFVWQLGNFGQVLLAGTGVSQTAYSSRLADVMFSGSLICFPLVFSLMCGPVGTKNSRARALILFGRYLRYLLWPWTVFAIVNSVLVEWDFAAIGLEV